LGAKETHQFSKMRRGFLVCANVRRFNPTTILHADTPFPLQHLGFPNFNPSASWPSSTPVGSENLIRPQIVNLQRLAAELLRPVFPPLALSNAA
jgi:hypothetical protein